MNRFCVFILDCDYSIWTTNLPFIVQFSEIFDSVVAIILSRSNE